MNRIYSLFNFLYNLCIKNTNYTKISPIISTSITITDSFVTIDLTDEKYYILTQNICNLKKLTMENMEYLKTLPKDKLLEIIKLYDNGIDTIHYIINLLHKEL